MSLVTFVHDGNAVDYTPTADVAAGEVVVQGDLVGIVRGPIPANRFGSVAVAGIFDFPKTSGTGTAIAAGTKVYWNATTKIATATADGATFLGKTTKAAADADTTVRVRLSQ
jgi:predicted RecA/RadA family phage recombinase